MNKYYGIHDEWTDIDKVNDIQIQSTDGVISGITVNGEESGGGSSNFGTAEVTIINNSSAPIIIDNMAGIDQEDNVITLEYPPILPNATGTLLAILYKGSTSFEAPFSIDEISGSATEGTGGIVTITGDCSITATTNV